MSAINQCTDSIAMLHKNQCYFLCNYEDDDDERKRGWRQGSGKVAGFSYISERAIIMAQTDFYWNNSCLKDENFAYVSSQYQVQACWWGARMSALYLGT